MESEEGFVDQLLVFLTSKDFPRGDASIIPVLSYPWNTASVINRLSEELGLRDFIVLTRRELVDDVYQSLSQEPNPLRDIRIYIDHAVARSILRDSVFENAVILEHVIRGLEDRVKEVYVDLTLTTGPFTIALQGIQGRLRSVLLHYTYVDVIPLPGLPQYPGSPKWIHRVYIYGGLDEGIPGNQGKNTILIQFPVDKIQWKGTRGIFESVSKIVNRLIGVRIAEKLSSEARMDISEDSPVLNIYALNTATGERKRLTAIKPTRGPDEDSVNMMMSSWRILSEIVCETHPDIDRSMIERVLMQFQRYTGAVDLIAREIEGVEAKNYEGWKIHSLLVDLYRRMRKPIALLPDTNMFYQGLHMMLLKASIRNGKPWSPIDGLRVYIPICAETEINGKVAGVSSETTGIARYSYIMALLANRAVEEIKQYYRGLQLPAVSQPCEASIAVVEQSLGEDRVVLVTADKKAYNAWVTLNVCKDRVMCIYVGHRNKPLNIEGLYSKLYASIVLSSQIYAAASITPVEISIGDKKTKIMLESLQGSGAPVLNVVEEQR